MTRTSPAGAAVARSALGEAAEASRGSAVRLAAEVAGRALSLATSFLIAVGLGVEAFGIFASLSGLAIVLAEAADLGLQTTASRALVAGTLPLRSIVRAKLVLTAALTVAVAVLLAFGAGVGGSLSGLLPESWPPMVAIAVGVAPLLAVLLSYYVLAGWSELLGVALRARGRRTQEAVVLLLSRAAALVVIALVFRGGAGLATVAWAQALSGIPPLVLAALLVLRANVSGDLTRGERAGVRRVLKESWPLAVNGGLALVSLRVELLLLFSLRGAREAGLFAAALKIIESLNGVPSAVAAGAMPALTREGIRGGAGTATARARTAVTVALLAVPAAVGLLLLAPGVASLLGPGYAEAAGPLRLLAPAVVALFMNVVLLHSLVAAGRAKWLPRLTAMRVAAAIALAIVLVPTGGAAGAAAGFLLSEVVLLLLAARATAAARFEVPLARPLAVAVCATLPMALAVVAWNGGPLSSALLGAFAYGVTLAVAFWLAPGLFGSSRRQGGPAATLSLPTTWESEGGR